MSWNSRLVLMRATGRTNGLLANTVSMCSISRHRAVLVQVGGLLFSPSPPPPLPQHLPHTSRGECCYVSFSLMHSYLTLSHILTPLPHPHHHITSHTHSHLHTLHPPPSHSHISHTHTLTGHSHLLLPPSGLVSPEHEWQHYHVIPVVAMETQLTIKDLQPNTPYR